MAAPRKKREKSEFEEVTIDIARVMRVTKGGRQLRFRALVVIGDRKGKVGAGTGKASEVSSAIQKAVAEAKKNMIEVVTKNDTIPHEINHKVKASRVRLLPASQGTGVIAGSAVRVVCELAGIKNILAKSFGSNNKLCLTEVTLQALSMLRTFKPHIS
jgi:small subunit ribosomal protein S5